MAHRLAAALAGGHTRHIANLALRMPAAAIGLLDSQARSADVGPLACGQRGMAASPRPFESGSGSAPSTSEQQHGVHPEHVVALFSLLAHVGYASLCVCRLLCCSQPHKYSTCASLPTSCKHCAGEVASVAQTCTFVPLTLHMLLRWSCHRTCCSVPIQQPVPWHQHSSCRCRLWLARHQRAGSGSR